MDRDQPFQKLFEPGRIGAMEIKNRIVMRPMATMRKGAAVLGQGR